MPCKIENCTAPVENEEIGLCATHAREARKLQAQALKPKKVYTIPQRSAKGQARETELQKTYRLFDASMPHHCSNCGDNFYLTHSHILPQGQYPEHAHTIINIVFDCIQCHDIWEHGDLQQVEQMTNFKYRLSVIAKLAPEYFFRRFSIALQDYRNK